jgi:dienelactone hydrolase
VARNYSSWQWFVRNVGDERAAADDAPARDIDVRVRAARRALRRAMGRLPERVPLNMEVLDSVDCGTYRRDKIVYDTERWMSVPAYLLVPHDRTRRGPAVLAQHGHGPGKDEVCGLVDQGDEGSEPNVYGHELARRGYVVLAPDLRTFGERADWDPPNIYHCDHAYMYASLLGFQLLALDLWDLARGIDVLCEHPLVDRRRIGMVGLSQGGTCTLFLAAWDRRVRAAVVSGYFNRWDACATIGWNMCGSQVLNGITTTVDHADLGALIAPRPLLVETGTQDNIFPAAAATRAMADLRPVYEALGAGDRLEHDVFDGPHKWHGVAAYPFLARWLGGDAEPRS